MSVGGSWSEAVFRSHVARTWVFTNFGGSAARVHRLGAEGRRSVWNTRQLTCLARKSSWNIARLGGVRSVPFTAATDTRAYVKAGMSRFSLAELNTLTEHPLQSFWHYAYVFPARVCFFPRFISRTKRKDHLPNLTPGRLCTNYDDRAWLALCNLISPRQKPAPFNSLSECKFLIWNCSIVNIPFLKNTQFD